VEGREENVDVKAFFEVGHGVYHAVAFLLVVAFFLAEFLLVDLYVFEQI